MAESEKLAFTVQEAADALGLSTDTVYQLVHRADFPAIRVGRAVRISRKLLERWLDDQIQAGKGNVL